MQVDYLILLKVYSSVQLLKANHSDPSSCLIDPALCEHIACTRALLKLWVRLQTHCSCSICAYGLHLHSSKLLHSHAYFIVHARQVHMFCTCTHLVWWFFFRASMILPFAIVEFAPWHILSSEFACRLMCALSLHLYAANHRYPPVCSQPIELSRKLH